MRYMLLAFLALLALLVASVVSHATDKSKLKIVTLSPDYVVPDDANRQIISDPSGQVLNPVVGTFTGLSGFYDYQSNGGAIEYIRVDSASGAIHVCYMVASDSADPNHALRRIAYSMSTNGGTTWNTFNNLLVPPGRRSGFPALDIGQGALANSTLIANHNDPGTGTQSLVYVDFPSGTGSFAELNPTGPLLGSAEPIWPFVAVTASGAIVISSSRSGVATDTVYFSVNPDQINWTPWRTFRGPALNGGRSPVIANGNGRVGILMPHNTAGVYWFESTDNGTTWPAQATQVFGPTQIVNGDTVATWIMGDVVYNGNNPLIALSGYNASPSATEEPRIIFWSGATGAVEAVAYDPVRFPVQASAQANHPFGVGWPAIGMSGSTIVIAFHVFQPEVSPAGNFNYGDIWMVSSTNGGASWSTPTNVTNTPALDERYPSISKWNAAGQANLTWQEDTQPGAHAFGDGAPVTRSSLIFHRVSLTTGVDDRKSIPTSFSLGQNYPNPFNPSTTIDYAITSTQHVRLTVFNSLGQEVATLVDRVVTPGEYKVNFNAYTFSSGVYMYRLQAGSYVETKKMVYVR